jgi:hypothetical protein
MITIDVAGQACGRGAQPDEVEVVEAGGILQMVRTEGAESRGQRLVRRLRSTATGRDIAGMSTDQIMALLRAE